MDNRWEHLKLIVKKEKSYYLNVSACLQGEEGNDRERLARARADSYSHILILMNNIEEKETGSSF